MERGHVTRAFMRSSRRKVHCHYPIVNYYPLFAASALRELIGSIVKPGSICPQIGPENSLVRNRDCTSAAVVIAEGCASVLGYHALFYISIKVSVR